MSRTGSLFEQHADAPAGERITRMVREQDHPA
jgi:hypothetical protein